MLMAPNTPLNSSTMTLISEFCVADQLHALSSAKQLKQRKHCRVRFDSGELNVRNLYA
jgi:hypothetical protein